MTRKDKSGKDVREAGTLRIILKARSVGASRIAFEAIETQGDVATGGGPASGTPADLRGFIGFACRDSQETSYLRWPRYVARK